jgi:hypothetical protein
MVDNFLLLLNGTKDNIDIITDSYKKNCGTILNYFRTNKQSDLLLAKLLYIDAKSRRISDDKHMNEIAGHLYNKYLDSSGSILEKDPLVYTDSLSIINKANLTNLMGYLDDEIIESRAINIIRNRDYKNFCFVKAFLSHCGMIFAKIFGVLTHLHLHCDSYIMYCHVIEQQDVLLGRSTNEKAIEDSIVNIAYKNICSHQAIISDDFLTFTTSKILHKKFMLNNEIIKISNLIAYYALIYSWKLGLIKFVSSLDPHLPIKRLFFIISSIPNELKMIIVQFLAKCKYQILYINSLDILLAFERLCIE